MTLISLHFEKGDGCLHEDLIIYIKGLEKPKALDSYYFFFALEDNDREKYYEIFLDHLIKIKSRIENATPEDDLLIPLDVSDQYTGYLCIRKFNNKGLFNVFYFTSTIYGHAIDPWNLDSENFYWKDLYGIDTAFYCYENELVESFSNSISQIKKFIESRTSESVDKTLITKQDCLQRLTCQEHRVNTFFSIDNKEKVIAYNLFGMDGSTRLKDGWLFFLCNDSTYGYYLDHKGWQEVSTNNIDISTILVENHIEKDGQIQLPLELGDHMDAVFIVFISDRALAEIQMIPMPK